MKVEQALEGQNATGKPRHYAWVIVVITFLTLLAAAGVRAAPGVFIIPFEKEYGWSRADTSLVVGISILIFGLGGPLTGSLIERFGPRVIMLGGLVMVSLGLLPMLFMDSFWQFFLWWGVVVGIGTGLIANVLGTTIAHRWFRTNQGLIVGLFSAAASTGQLAFLPIMSALTVAINWRWAIGFGAIFAGLLILPVFLFMRNRPEDVNLKPIGDKGESAAAQNSDTRRYTLRQALKTRDFWLLAGGFFICGYTSNGLVGTHLIPHAVEHGFTQVQAAGAVGLMGLMNVVGTLGSGWLTDRYDSRKLLAIYYGFRAISIAVLPFILEYQYLLIFAVVYGLDWIATVPPTTALVARIYGKASLGILFGWIFFGHMLGASIAAYAGGFFRQILGDYHVIFISAALLGIIASGISLMINPSSLRNRTPEPLPSVGD